MDIRESENSNVDEPSVRRTGREIIYHVLNVIWVVRAIVKETETNALDVEA